jgi:adenylate cyclase
MLQRSESGFKDIESMQDSNADKPSRTWTSSLRSLLGLVMVAMLIVVSATLVGLDYRRARSAAIAGAEDNMDAFVGRLVDRLGVLSGDTSALVSLVASVANSFLVPPPERMNDKVAVLREGIARSPHIDGVYVGYPSGAFFHVVDLDSAAWRMALDAPRGAAIAVRSMERNDQGKPFDRILFLDASGLQFAERHAASNGFDPRTRPWYRAAVNGKAPVAIGPYEMATTGNLGMTISQAHRGNPQIVIGADVVLDTITDFLSRERLTDDSVSFVLDAVGRPIIHSDSTTMRRIMASKGRDRPVATPQEDGLIESIRRNPPPAGKATLVEVGNRTYLVTVAPLESALLLSGHRVVVAAPLDELLAAANETLVQGLAVSGAVVVVAVLLALVLAHLITKSLNQLTDSANRLQDLDFATPIDVSSHVAEISTLNGAMNRARDAIFTFALYVPKELVRKGIESGHFGGRAAWRQEERRRQGTAAIYGDGRHGERRLAARGHEQGLRHERSCKRRGGRPMQGHGEVPPARHRQGKGPFDGARHLRSRENGMVPRRGLEPPHPFGYQHLKLARLPIPPSGRRRAMYGCDLPLSTGFLKFPRPSPKKRGKARPGPR